MKSRTKKIIIGIVVVLFLLPFPVQCGNIFWDCAAPPMSDGYSYDYSYFKPLVVVLVDSLLDSNLPIVYWKTLETTYYEEYDVLKLEN